MSKKPPETKPSNKPKLPQDIVPDIAPEATASTKARAASQPSLVRGIFNRPFSLAFGALFIAAGVLTGGIGPLVFGVVLGAGLIVGPVVYGAYKQRQERLALEKAETPPEENKKQEPKRSATMNKASKWGLFTTLGVGLGVLAFVALGIFTGGVGFLAAPVVIGAVTATVLGARALHVASVRQQERSQEQQPTVAASQQGNEGKAPLEKAENSPEENKKQEQKRSATMNKASKWGLFTALGVGLGVLAFVALGIFTGGVGFLAAPVVIGTVTATVLGARALHVASVRQHERSQEQQPAVAPSQQRNEKEENKKQQKDYGSRATVEAKQKKPHLGPVLKEGPDSSSINSLSSDVMASFPPDNNPRDVSLGRSSSINSDTSFALSSRSLNH